MGKTQSRIKRLLKIDFKGIIILSICLGISIVNIVLALEQRKVNEILKLSKEEITKTLNNINESNITLSNKITSLNLKLEVINNIDEEIKKIREEFFINAKKVEDNVLNGTLNKRIAYLTFDDGPYTMTTAYFLDILDEKDVLATFFTKSKIRE